MESYENVAEARGFSNEDLDLLAYLLAEEGIELDQRPSIPRRASDAEVPLSFTQQRLWFLDQLQPGSAVYHLPTVIRVSGRLDLAALEKTFTEIVCRHEILRTTFSTIEGNTQQIIAPPAPVSFPVIDLSNRAAEVSEAEVRRLTHEEVIRPFDLSIGPLMRMLLIRLSDEEHIVIATLHHIISDGWSSMILVREISALYQEFTTGRPSGLAELPLQYGDYAIWERERMQGEELQSQLDYWRRQLDHLQVLALPLDHPRPAVQTFRGANRTVVLPRAAADALIELGQSEDATLFMVLLAAYALLLSRYTAQTDIAVGTVVANRRAELEPLIGFFASTLVLRLDTSGCRSFRELVAHAREVCLGAYAHQDLPFEKLVEELQPERSLSHTPLFQTVLVMQNVPPVKYNLEGLQLQPLPTTMGASKFDLSLAAEDFEYGLTCSFEYNTDLFEPATIARSLDQFRTLLEAAAGNPDQALASLPLLNDAERRELLAKWSGPQENYCRTESLHQLFEQQVERTPQAIAVSFEQEQLTYAELNAHANQLAHYLRAQGVGSEVPVALCLERSVEMVVAILGVLKAGGAYVPLDPANPRERLAFILQDTRAPVLLTNRIDLLPDFAGTTFAFETDHELLSEQSEQNLCVNAAPENTAYIIYTSGSAGRPKGTYITHSNVTRLFSATDQWFNFGSQDVWTLFHSYAFDFSVWELWGALLYGGRLVVVPYWISRTPENFYELLHREQVTILNQTPSAFRQLMRAEESGLLPELSLRLIIFGGEALQPVSLKPWVEKHGDQHPQLINMYGITETTVHVTCRRLLRSDVDGTPASVIGIPLNDLQVYVLDRKLEPVPIGVSGEMFVGGEGLARGYLNHVSLTAERFVPDPFSTTAGARLYKTGDLARYTGNGEFEYLGRCDQQVKIKGFRIELGEVEAVLDAHPAVRSAVVVSLVEPDGERRLVAYATLKEHSTGEQLRAFVKDRLPEYMIPAAFVVLDEMPLTSNGKIDRRALPVPERTRSGSDESYVVPRTETEEVLAAIWANVLGVERVGIHDNFFALGGDSILSVRVMGMAKERGINFSLQELFQSQTIAELAAQLHLSEIHDAPEQHAGPFNLITEADRAKLPGDIEDAYPLAMLQAGMLYHIAYSPGEMIYHNVYSYHLRARLEIEAFREAVRKVVARHPMLRTSFDLITYSKPLQLVHNAALLSVELDDVRQVTSEEQERILDEFIESEKRRQFDYSKPPLLRLHIHRRTEDSFNFTLTEYHPILDGWSLHSLLSEIFTSYFASLDGRPVLTLPPPSSTYGEFVRRERLALASEEYKLYWHGKLRDIKPVELPRWPAVSPRADSPRIHKLNYPLSDETSRGLKNVARSLGLPLKSVLLAAHLKVLSVVCGQSDIVTGLVSNGRPEETDGDKTIGLFFNTVPFHAKISGGSWRELIQATFKAELELLPYRRYPIAALQQQWGRKPLFDTVFNYLHFHVLDDLARSGDLELIGPTRYWEETNLALSTAFRLSPLSDTIALVLRFDTTQFSMDQIESISGYYTRVLEAIAAGTDEPHARQSFLAGEEQQKILTEWSGSPSELTEPHCVHRLFEDQANSQPDAISVVYEGDSLTYGQLNERSNRLARELQRRGVGPEVPVVVCLERSIEAVVSILAVLKAGGAYVPVEPGHPPQRIAMMIAEIAAPVLLTQQKLISRLSLSGIEIVCVDEEWEDSAQTSEHNSVSNVLPGNLAYLIFTSGSTGKPKAVAIEHRQLFNYVQDISERLKLSGRANYALASTFAADLGHTVIFPSLMSGGVLHILSTQRLSDPEALAEYFDLHEIDCLKIVPSHLAALLANVPTGRILPRQRLILGGDVCHRELVEKVQNLSPDCVVFNHYGPTETTVGVLSHNCKSDRQLNGTRPVPLGRPHRSAEVYLLDTNLNPVPTLTPGEIYIGGKGVSRGYFNEPMLTAEQFVPHPFSHEAGARLYRSGDLGRYLHDGNIEFLGRKDHQVKVRGYRVELGEIEAVLHQHPAIARAVAIFDRDEQQLIAYVVAKSELPPKQSELRSYLREKLPDYAVPSVLVFAEALPLTPSGKIDRSALPRPDSIAPKIDAAYVAPGDETERTIAAIWRDCLKVERVSVHDNFFDLGGHSLVVLQIQSKLREVLQRDIPIVAMFEHPTISSLAKHLNAMAPEANLFSKAQEEAAARRAMLAQQRHLIALP